MGSISPRSRTPGVQKSMWRKGDPIPDSWPAWLREADILWCDVEISDLSQVIWQNGIWQTGIWQGGLWQGGLWQTGLWRGGIWRGGIWQNGTWENGIWQNGTWENGVWKAGTWENGVWKAGTWKAGTWENGVWKAGTWKAGTWSPAQKRAGGRGLPRFSGRLMIDQDGQFHLGGSETTDIPPELANEAKLLRYYYELELQEPSSERPTLWEHLDDLV